MKLAVQPGLQHSAIECEGGGVQDLHLHDDCIRRAANSSVAKDRTHLKAQLHEILPASDFLPVSPLDGRGDQSSLVDTFECPAANFSEKARFPEAETGKPDILLQNTCSEAKDKNVTTKNNKSCHSPGALGLPWDAPLGTVHGKRSRSGRQNRGRKAFPLPQFPPVERESGLRSSTPRTSCRRQYN